MMIPTGVIVVAAIVVPWYAALYHRYGWTYITSFFLGENVARYTEGVGVRDAARAARSTCRWSSAIRFRGRSACSGRPACGSRERRRMRAKSLIQTPEAVAARRVRALMWLWVLGIVAFFSFSAAKQDLYIFPIVPVVAALGGLLIARSRRDGTPEWLRSLRVTAGGDRRAAGGCGARDAVHLPIGRDGLRAERREAGRGGGGVRRCRGAWVSRWPEGRVAHSWPSCLRSSR